MSYFHGTTEAMGVGAVGDGYAIQAQPRVTTPSAAVERSGIPPLVLYGAIGLAAFLLYRHFSKKSATATTEPTKGPTP